MSDFKDKMYQIQFRLRLRPRPRWGSSQRSPRPPSWIKGPTSKGRGGEGGKRRKRGGDGKGKRKGRGGDGTPALHAPLIHISGYAPDFGYLKPNLFRVTKTKPVQQQHK